VRVLGFLSNPRRAKTMRFEVGLGLEGRDLRSKASFEPPEGGAIDGVLVRVRLPREVHSLDRCPPKDAPPEARLEIDAASRGTKPLPTRAKLAARAPTVIRSRIRDRGHNHEFAIVPSSPATIALVLRHRQRLPLRKVLAEELHGNAVQVPLRS
jgi:hypothetical protein